MGDAERPGSGPGEIAPDGSAVEFYAALSLDDKSAALVHDAIPAGASVLDLGAGTGRITRPLMALGHPVVAVDESAEMLAHVTGARTVCSRIEELDLGRTFGAVLLASYLITYGSRRPLLDACRRHVAGDGPVILQRNVRGWFDAAAPREWTHDGVHYRMYGIDRPGPDLVTATIEYRMGERMWTHTFTSRRLEDEELPGLLGASGLRLERFLDDDGGWILARPV